MKGKLTLIFEVILTIMEPRVIPATSLFLGAVGIVLMPRHPLMAEMACSGRCPGEGAIEPAAIIPVDENLRG